MIFNPSEPRVAEGVRGRAPEVCGVRGCRHSVAVMASPTAGITLSDPTFEPKDRRNAFERFWLNLISDERDLPFIPLALQMTFVIIPLAVLLYVPGVFRWWLAPVYWAVVFPGFMDRYMLMLHNASHRRLFKRKYNFMNKWVPWVIGIFCGQTPETYYIHHITMHHAEGNLPNDLSSTMKYQRDSRIAWLRYFFRFFFFILFDMTRYQLRKKRYPLLRKMLIGELSFYAITAVMMFVNWQATVTVFVVPLVVIRILMMAGNWGQHAFVDPDDPSNDYKSAITCINARYNHRGFNDGYHISHHLVANRHWTDHPAELQENLQAYVDNDAIIFEGIDFFMVWLYLMLGRKDWLVERFVDLREEKRSKEEILALFERRLKKFSPEQLAALQK
ncbi:MAG TPA: fatty acid desaturase [Myxococcales bacterium]|nr:fatty acid desaturase [Myxococcales bacterium]